MSSKRLCITTIFLVLLLGACGGSDPVNFTSIGIFNGLVNKPNTGELVYRFGVALAENPAAEWTPQEDVGFFPDEVPDYQHLSKGTLVLRSQEPEFYILAQATNLGPPRESDILAMQSADGKTWEFVQDSQVIEDGASPTLLFEESDDENPYKVWFSRGNDTYYATSSDGITYTSPVEVIPAAIPKAITIDEGEYLLFVLCFDDDERMEGCVARASQVDGPWAAARERPLLKREKNADHELASDGTAGEKTVIVDATEGFYVGQDVLIMNNLKQWQYLQIAELDEDTRELTFDRTLTIDYLTGDASFVTSVASGDVYPTSVWKDAQGWHMQGTCFNHSNDREGVAYLELSCAASGPTLNEITWDWFGAPPLGHPLAYDDDFLFTTSAENLSIVFGLNTEDAP